MTARDPLRDVLVMDLMVGGLTRKAAEVQVAAFEQARRARVAEEFAAAVEASETHPGCAGCKGGVLFAADKIRRMAAPTTTQEP